MSNERFYDSFLDMVQEEVDVNTLMKSMKFIEDDGYGKSRRKEEVDGTSNDIVPKVSLTALMAKARKVSKKRSWIKKEEIKAAVGDEMDDKTFDKYWEDRKTKYVRSRHIEFGKDSFGNEIVSTGRRGLVPRPKDDSDLDEFLSSLRGEEGGETVSVETDNLMEAAFTDGDPVFMNDYTSQLEGDYRPESSNLFEDDETVSEKTLTTGDYATIRSAVKTLAKGVSVGLTKDGKTIIFLSKDYDNKGNLRKNYLDVSPYGESAFYLLAYNYGDAEMKELGYSEADRKELLKHAKDFYAQNNKNESRNSSSGREILSEGAVAIKANQPLFSHIAYRKDDEKEINYGLRITHIELVDYDLFDVSPFLHKIKGGQVSIDATLKLTGELFAPKIFKEENDNLKDVGIVFTVKLSFKLNIEYGIVRNYHWISNRLVQTNFEKVLKNAGFSILNQYRLPTVGGTQTSSDYNIVDEVYNFLREFADKKLAKMFLPVIKDVPEKNESCNSSFDRETLFEDIAEDEDEEFKSNFRRKSKDGYSLEFEIGDEDCGCDNCDCDDDDSDQEFKGGYDYKAADGEDRTEDFAAHLNSLVDFVKDHEWDAVEKALAPETLAKKKIFMVADFHKKLSDFAEKASAAAKDDDESAEKSNADKMTKEIEKMLNKVD
jgi:hypothetical protein